ncbi:MAG: cell surface protein SprA [Bacteroidales bacterium]|nr:cell surface protein SprA [Bacteroidales bacterium]
MIKKLLVIITVFYATFGIISVEGNCGNVSSLTDNNIFDIFTSANQPDSLKFPLKDSVESPLYLKNPSNITETVEYDAERNEYILVKKIGDVILEQRALTFEEYQQYDMDKMIDSYWQTKNKTVSSSASSSKSDGSLSSLIPAMRVNSDWFETIFGGQEINIRPSGALDLKFAIVNNRNENMSLSENRRSTTSFDFDEDIQLNVQAQIGTAINFNLNYNTGATFDFEKELFKLKYEGKEDDIVQLLEAGNISFSLPTSLITGVQNLFGIRGKFKFGNLMLDAVISQQKSESQSITVQNGAQSQEFNFKADEYEDNKHFFLAQYFYDNYNKSMESFPVLNSNIIIKKVEVWRTNVGSAVNNNRNIVAFADLGEKNPFGTMPYITNPNGTEIPDNYLSNDLLNVVDKNSLRSINSVSSYLQGMGFVSGQNFEKVESARKLNPSEYTVNEKLGFISLTQGLSNDQVLAVAFQYQIVGDSTVYQVGEFSDDGIADPNTLVVKLLKSSTLNTRNPMWKLMMKNVYWIGSSQIAQEDFRLNILYLSEESGVQTGYFTEGDYKGIPLLQVFGLDRMDNQQNMLPDGVFDFVSGTEIGAGTINAARGLIYFPTVEPFGKDLRAKLNNDELADKYCFDSLYTLTKSQAMQYTEKDKFYLEGRYRSSSSGGEISLGAVNVPQGSVTVMAGGIKLQEGVDYTVDYAMGRVRIINSAYLSSGTPITVSTESNTTFSMVTKRMLGIRGTYTVSPELSLGATIMNLHESPLTTKVNYGEEPINNTLAGFDIHLTKSVPFITKILNWLPFYDTKAQSNLVFEGEVATFLPGNSSAIGRSGIAYIDDFETSKRSYDLKSVYSWHLASTPQDFNTSNSMFPETFKNSGLAYGFNRAKIAWYSIDDNFYTGAAPSNISKDDISQPYARLVRQSEIYPNKDIVEGTPTDLHTLDIAFYPSERGPYNYDTVSVWSKGLNEDGLLASPQTRWGGIMRKIDATDFDAANIEYIEFWLMDPFIDNDQSEGGKLYFNLGDISEDILRDGRKSYENGLPTTAVVTDVDTTIWGRVPRLQSVVNAFSNEDNSRPYQDIGYDGLNSSDEQTFFAEYLNKIQSQLNAEAYNKIFEDPSADDYSYFRSSDYDRNNVKVTDRYKKYNNPEGNSAVTNSGESTQSSSLPNVEDINQDNTLSEAENYYEYEIDLRPDRMNVGENYITDIQTARNISLPNGQKTDCKWYQFRIPIREPSRKVGTINGYQSIRFMRTFLRGFTEPVILRFGTLELVSAEWRKYDDNLLSVGAYPPSVHDENTTFTVGTVNIEENGKRSPIPYNLPPGIDRELMYSTTSATQQNEQAMSLKVANLGDGDARAVYKTMDYDMRQYKKLKLFVHGEQMNENDSYKDGEVSVFIRLGADFVSNYYEYEMPIKLTPWYTSAIDRNIIWPADNEIEINLDSLVKVKERRNMLVRSGNIDYSNNVQYTEYKGNRKITVLGNPNIADVKVFMLGIRNPKKQSPHDEDDMLPKSVEVWVNELRLTDFNKKAGWAARGSMRTNLADLGDLALSGSYRSAGFGTIEQKISTISQDNTGAFDVATNLELGKFFPDNFGLRIPFHFDYSKTVSNPRYNPLDPDVLLKNDLLSYRSEKERDSIRHMVQDYTTITNFSLMNLRKERMGTSALHRHFYDVENFTLSYSYSKIYRRNIDIDHNQQLQNRLILNYQYEAQTKGWKPFVKMPLFKGKSWAILRDFTLNYIPKSITFKSDMLRDYQETLNRSKSQGLVIMEPYFYKNFYWNREYGFKYDITNSLRAEYSSTMNSLIEEPRGRIDTREKKDSVWQSITDLGKAMQFTQNIRLNYNAPISKIPALNWVRLNGNYTAQYTFQGSTNATESLGNTIENSMRINATGSLAFATLYNKFSFIKKAYESRDKKRGLQMTPRTPVRPNTTKDNKNTNVKDSTDSVQNKNYLKEFMYFSIRLLTSVKNASFNYSLTDGTYIPGFMPRARFFGMSDINKWAPGWGFILGSQKDIMPDAIRNGWLTKDTLFNSAFVQKHNETVTGQIKIEPAKDFNIDLSFKRTRTEQYSSYYKFNDELGDIAGPLSAYRNGTFSISIIALGTMFSGSDKDNISKVFEQFLKNRQTIAHRLADKNKGYNSDYSGEEIWDTVSNQYWPDGYNSSSQQVLIPSFLAAYLNKDASSQSLSPFIKMPMPNWRITWTGLGKLDWVKKWANSITLSSNYTCNYNITSFYTNTSVPDVSQYDYGTEWVRNSLNSNFIPKHTIDQIAIAEQLSPLLKIDINLKNSFQLNFEVRKDRNLNLSFSNNQLTEVTRNGLVIGGGYRFKDVRVQVRTGNGNSREFKSDIFVKADLSVTSNKTVLRKIDQNVNLISAGSKVATLNLSGEYSLTEKIILKAFFDMTINTPYISSSYPNSTTEGGFSVKIIL